MTEKEFTKKIKEVNRAQKKKQEARFLNLQSMNGNTWAIFRAVLGSRMTGKSYAVTERMCKLRKSFGNNVKCYWMRIADTSTKQLLCNNARNLVDPDLVRKYNLDLKTKGNVVYNHSKEFCEVYPLASFGKLKGQAFYDKDFKGKYFIVLDEFQLEQGEKRTSFDILYNFIGMLENIARTSKNNVEVWLLGNTLEEASTILKAFNFLPEKFGRFYLKSKRCIIDNLEPTEEYLKERKGSMADILGGDAMSNYTNELTKDRKLIDKSRCKHPTTIIMFDKDKNWYTLWDGKIIKKYNKEQLPTESCIAMQPYLDVPFNKEKKIAVIQMYDAQAFRFDNLITQSYFTGELQKIRKQ